MFAIAIGDKEIILIVGIASCFIAYKMGRNFAKSLRDDQTKIFGAAAALAGILIAIYGISSINSMSSQMMAYAGRVDVGGMAAIVIGAWVGAMGIGILVKGGTIQKDTHPTNTKKCSFCAETIQAEAKLCRYCGKADEIELYGAENSDS